VDRSGNSDVEFRIVLFYVFRSVLAAKLLNHGFHLFAVTRGSEFKFTLCAARINPNSWILEDVLIPLCVGTLNGLKVQLVAFQHKPDRVRDRAS